MGIIDGLNTIIDTLLSYRVDYNTIDQLTFTFLFSIYSLGQAMLIALTLSAICINSKKKAIQKFENEYPKETVLFVGQSDFFIILVWIFSLAFFFICFIAPYIFIKNMHSEMIPLLDFLPFRLICTVFLFIITIFILNICNLVHIISDKQIIRFGIYKLFNIFPVKRILFKNIEKIEYKFTNHAFLHIKLKNGKGIEEIGGFSNLDKAEKIIKDELRYGKY